MESREVNEQINEIWYYFFEKEEHRRKSRVQAIILFLLVINVVLILLWRVGLPMFWSGVNQTNSFVKFLEDITPRAFVNKKDPLVKEEEEVNGYKVTSGFYECDEPSITTSDCRGNPPSPHKAVDVATPIGKVLYAPGKEGTKVEVKCNFQKDLGGLWAEIIPEETPYKFQALHLNNCDSGEYIPGQVFAATGNSGRSTGPHLDWRQVNKNTENKTHPTYSWLYHALSGEPPNIPIKGR